MKPTWGRPDLSAGLALLAIFCVLAAVAQADTRDQAKRIHDRIAGVPPDDATLTLMADDIARGDPLRAALRAAEAPEFYGVTLRNFAAPWTNREGNVFVPLNDYTATVIGMVRDELDFRLVLSGDLIYSAPAPIFQLIQQPVTRTTRLWKRAVRSFATYSGASPNRRSPACRTMPPPAS
jgi:hypothetical protein